jgi:hypothetical protein
LVLGDGKASYEEDIANDSIINTSEKKKELQMNNNIEPID